ncbi:porin [Bradyrhizobium sp. CCGUVB1N3]|uniref:porin n=1 Tax=Bradyrhizobium sp. CCGUVB1N3 TaxID=2949629 RepID=UPI0020B1C30D|nr:porin [Bradyrhizobium sp. CCGUVB1N3]MCP3470365.1 porin [Bradyrhizobium sp. CCGUVB1N3]
MKLVKSFLLGSAAGLIAVGGAQAADLPVKAKAVEYVKICSLYGAGFYYMPGTDTCIKFGGYVRADTSVGAGDYNFQQGANQGANNRLTNYWFSRARMDFTVDTRTATEYGVVRTYADMVFTWTSNTLTGSNGSAQGSSDGSAQLGLFHAFVQFAGFTFGKTVSIFDAPWTGYPAGGPDTLPGGSNFTNGVNQVAYTADFGQGITGSVALQDLTTAANGQSNLWNVSSGTAAQFVTGVYGANDWGGTRSPDIVGNVRVDQAWGLAQISVAAHDIHSAYYGTTEVSGHPADKWGWAVSGVLSIKNIPTGPGDVINLQAVYTDGASRYNFQSLFPQSFFMFSGTGLAGAYQSVGIAGVADGVFGTGTGIDTVKTWGFRGGYTHNWTPNWASAVYGGYGQLRYGDTGKALICTNFATIAVAGSTCNPDFNFAVIGVNTVWTPVKNLAFTADVNWSHLDQKYTGAINSPGIAASAKPAAVYELKDQNSVSMLLRAQRNF